MPERHARMGASSASRWLNCPGALALGELFPKEDSSEFAEEGTVAHSLAEARLRFWNKELTERGFERRLHEIRKAPQYSAGMNDYVTEYVDAVKQGFARLTEREADRAKHGFAHLQKYYSAPVELFVETQVDLSHWAPESFGTTDATLVSPGMVEVYDLKYGKGVPVSAEDNPQLKLYALGALAENYKRDEKCTYPERVALNIIQPRLAAITRYEMETADLLGWGGAIQGRVSKAWNGVKEFHAGDWCRFCPARALCKARAADATGVLDAPRSPELLTEKELAELWPKVDQVRKWASHVTSYATKAAESGVDFPGLKLIHGRANRTVVDQVGLIDSIEFDEGPAIRKELFRAPELKSITDLEKLFGRKKFAQYADGFVDKPAGKPTLVADKDPRPAITTNAQAATMFSDLGQEDDW